ncbi:MAG: hypothetical protein AB7K71_18520 [Polyangiaceae bacterium]
MRWLALGTLAVLGFTACGSDTTLGGSSGESGAGAQSGSGGQGGSAGSASAGSSSGGSSSSTGGSAGQDAGVSAPGWQSAYVDGAQSFSCDADLETLKAQLSTWLEFDGVTLAVGFEQVGNNQNPLVARFDGDTQTYCVKHETSGPDGRAWGLTWDGGSTAYVVYTIVGGGTELENRGGWLSSYAPGAISGGGSKVSYVGKINAGDGELARGTFIIAVKSDNKVNSHSPAGPITVLESGDVEFLGSSAHKPIDVNQKPMDCTDYPFSSRYRFSPDLDQVICADCTNCQSATPCQ